MSDDDRTQFMPPRREVPPNPPSVPATPPTPPPPARPLESTPEGENLVAEFVTLLQPVGASRQKRPISEVARPAQASTEMATQISGSKPRAEAQSRILKGRFVIEEILGAGGMGVVYKAKDLLKVEAQDREPYVAIKVLGEAFKEHPEAFISLQRESRKTQKIAHPNIVNVHDFDRDGETVFMTMEFLDGKPLDKLISQYKATGLLPEDAHRILRDISAALIHAHRHKIIHSDFKPGNIFVIKNSTAKVLDFGIARAAAIADLSAHTGEEDHTLFDAGSLGALTPAYASLEMLKGETPDARDDIYALGCIAYEMFTGQHPFNRKPATEAITLQLKPKRIATLNKRQWRAIELALAFHRSDRIASVEEFWQLFSYKNTQKNALAWILFCALLAAGGAAYYFWPQPQQGPDVLSIEKRLRQELSEKAIKKLLAEPTFSAGWQEQLWSEMSEGKQLVGEQNTWWQGLRQKIIGMYGPKIEEALKKDALSDAQALFKNYERYGPDQQQALDFQSKIAALAAKIQEAEQKRLAEAQQRAQQQAQQVTQNPVTTTTTAQPKTTPEPDDHYKVALDTVTNQLACASTPDIRDLEISVGKLKSINAQNYAKDEPKIIAALAGCVKKISESSVPRAEELKKMSLRLFPANALLSSLQFAAKDNCPLSLAGLGATGGRGSCKDALSDGSRTPNLVVVPASGDVKAFAIGKYEITVDEFNAYCKSSGRCSALSGDGNLPATQISLTQAQGYAEWLSKKTGKIYRLPTRTEWVYAARAGNDQPDPNRNCTLNSRGIQKGDVLVSATVGGANRWGLVNHIGNAREWAMAGGSAAALGGSRETAMDQCTASNASPHDGKADNVTGFRLVREISGN
ncbi:MAG TPA: bifunctional serine/threonine-protein kinase/formylglycine-generating enzyme family protein [Cellvibrionaceae bacterium]